MTGNEFLGLLFEKVHRNNRCWFEYGKAGQSYGRQARIRGALLKAGESFSLRDAG